MRDERGFVQGKVATRTCTLAPNGLFSLSLSLSLSPCLYIVVPLLTVNSVNSVYTYGALNKLLHLLHTHVCVWRQTLTV